MLSRVYCLVNEQPEDRRAADAAEPERRSHEKRCPRAGPGGC